MSYENIDTSDTLIIKKCKSSLQMKNVSIEKELRDHEFIHWHKTFDYEIFQSISKRGFPFVIWKIQKTIVVKLKQ